MKRRDFRGHAFPVLLSYEHPAKAGGFFCAENRMWTGTPVKANTLDRAGDGQTSAPDFCIFASPLVLLPVFCEEHIRANTPVKTNTPNGAGGCSPHFSDFRIALRSRRPGGFLRAVCVRRPDLDGGGHLRRDGLSPGSSPSGRGGGILPDQLQSGGISV